MDTDSGRFVAEAEAQPWMQRITIGEVVTIKGEDCRVVRISGRRVELELMSADDRTRDRLKNPNRHERRALESIIKRRGGLSR